MAKMLVPLELNKSVTKCANLTYVPTTVVVPVVFDGFVVGKFWFPPPPKQSWLVSALDRNLQDMNFPKAFFLS